MSTSKDFCNYVVDQLSDLPNITTRPMMGEYLIYCDGVLIGGIYDERLLLKEVPSLAKFDLPQVTPYSTAKRTMFYLEDLDDRAKLQEIILAAYQDLSFNQTPKQK